MMTVEAGLATQLFIHAGTRGWHRCQNFEIVRFNTWSVQKKGVLLHLLLYSLPGWSTRKLKVEKRKAPARLPTSPLQSSLVVS